MNNDNSNAPPQSRAKRRRSIDDLAETNGKIKRLHISDSLNEPLNTIFNGELQHPTTINNIPTAIPYGGEEYDKALDSSVYKDSNLMLRDLHFARVRRSVQPHMSG